MVQAADLTIKRQRRARLWSSLLTGATLLAVALCGFFFEELQDWLPWLTELQFRSYNWVSQLEARKPRLKFVTVVEIDDETFYNSMGLASGDATDRVALAAIIRRIGAFHPAVIALDLDLSHEPVDDKEPRKTANLKLLAAIRDVVEQHIPVVLTFGFVEGTRKRAENIFPDASLPYFDDPRFAYRARVGFDNASDDLRKVPLVVLREPSGKGARSFDSFALAVAGAYEDVLGIGRNTSKRLAAQISRLEFVYTSFLPQSEFPKLSASRLLEPGDQNLIGLSHRVVLIGGNRHRRPRGGDNEYVDDHELAPLRMRGMYLQANYIEGLLDDRIRSTVPRWAASAIDLGLALLMIRFSKQGKRLPARLALLAVFLVPVIFAYIASVNLGYVIDFVLPLLLLFIHAFLEHYLHLQHLAHLVKETHPDG